jgi:ferredoxin-NADP reductase
METTGLPRTSAVGHNGLGKARTAAVDSQQSPMFYISGSASMVAAAVRTLIEAGVDEDRIRTEDRPVKNHMADGADE